MPFKINIKNKSRSYLMSKLMRTEPTLQYKTVKFN